jgi:hypothetical protein
MKIVILIALLLFISNALAWSISFNNQQHNCAQVEALKTAQRQSAIKEYNRLDETLTLLNLQKTPQIVHRAQADRNAKLKEFAPAKCSGIFG